jgi:hypothetical protein
MKTRIGTPEVLATLQPGELTVQILRGELTIPPDHTAIARANWAIKHWGAAKRGEYRGRAPNDSQAECLTGAV